MRDLTFVDAPLSMEEVAARIESPGRFRPEPRIVKSVTAWKPHHPAVEEVFRGLEAGEPLDVVLPRGEALLDKNIPGLFEKEIRRYLLALQKSGHIEIPFEPAPPVYAGRYERLRELGRGGMGIVDLCADRERGGEKVVIKRAWGWARRIERSEHTNRQEARVLRMLDHPAFPKLRDAFEDRGILHMVRDFVDGDLFSGATLPTSRGRRDACAQLADALDHMHGRGLLYLDAKPGNFLLSKEGHVHVIDLGVARTFDEAAARRSRVGSAGFAAPEVRKGAGATPLSDQFSLGAVLFTLATGGRPRRGWGPTGIAEALAATKVDDEEQAIIRRMTDWDAAKRFPDMRTAAKALRG